MTILQKEVGTLKEVYDTRDERVAISDSLPPIKLKGTTTPRICRDIIMAPDERLKRNAIKAEY